MPVASKMEASPLDKLRDRIKYLTTAKRKLTATDLREASRLNEIGKQLCRDKAAGIIRKNKYAPVLNIYMNDGWSCRVRENIRLEVLQDLK